MELRAGYKQTEVGIIPEEWSVKPLADVLDKARLGGNYPNQDAESDFPLMKMGNVARGLFDLTSVEYITPAVFPENQHRLLAGDVIFNTRNTLDLVGKVAIWRDELPVAYYNSNLLRLEFKHFEIASNEYVNYWLNTATAVSNLRALATGTTSVAAIYTRDLLRFSIVVPPLQEQSAIATALGDVDALLAAQDALIAKNHAIKQGAMQELLTGKRRLPGFSGEWDVKPLSDIADVIDPHPSHRAPREVANGIPFLGIGDLDEDGNIVGNRLRRVESSILAEHSARYKLDEQLIGLGRVASIGKVVSLKVQSEDYAISPTLGLIRGREVEFDYLKYALRSSFIVDQFSQVMSGSTRSSIGMEVLRKLKVLLPNSRDEQAAVAKVMSDMDAELTALEAQRAKTAQLKQGMMQALLTGRIRLV